MVWARLQLFDWLAEEIAAVDVMRLASSKGGNGTPQGPRV
jgi:hypothetical protein